MATTKKYGLMPPKGTGSSAPITGPLIAPPVTMPQPPQQSIADLTAGQGGSPPVAGLPTPIDWKARYGEILNSQIAAIEAKYAQQKADLEATLPKVKQSYDAQRANTYQNARIGAIGNNELLAARGLAGNAYGGPMSGTSETSRIGQDMSMRNALNAAGLQQRSAEEGINQNILNAGFTRDQATNEATAALNQEMLSAEQADAQWRAEYEAQQRAAEEQARQQSYNNAMNELYAFGKIVTQAAADALGYPIGTTLKKIKGTGGGTRQPAPGPTGTTPTAGGVLGALGLIPTTPGASGPSDLLGYGSGSGARKPFDVVDMFLGRFK